jgi:hypothetical protein
MRHHMILWDIECENCGNVWESWAEGNIAPNCPICDSAFTNLLPGGLHSDKAKDPYDYLDRRLPGKRVTVGPHRSK